LVRGKEKGREEREGCGREKRVIYPKRGVPGVIVALQEPVW